MAAASLSPLSTSVSLLYAHSIENSGFGALPFGKGMLWQSVREGNDMATMFIPFFSLPTACSENYVSRFDFQKERILLQKSYYYSSLLLLPFVSFDFLITSFLY